MSRSAAARRLVSRSAASIVPVIPGVPRISRASAIFSSSIARSSCARDEEGTDRW